MTTYILELKVIDDDTLVHQYEQAIAKMQTEEYKNNPHKDSGFDIELILVIFCISFANILTFLVLSFSWPFKLKGNPKTTPPTLYSLNNIMSSDISFLIPFLINVLTGVAIVYVLSLIAIPIVLSPKSRPDRICDVLICSINNFGLDIIKFILK